MLGSKYNENIKAHYNTNLFVEKSKTHENTYSDFPWLIINLDK